MVFVSLDEFVSRDELCGWVGAVMVFDRLELWGKEIE